MGRSQGRARTHDGVRRSATFLSVDLWRSARWIKPRGWRGSRGLPQGSDGGDL